MATHEGFKRLMADLEIYVDRIASMQIQNLNAYIDTVRLEIQQRYNPDTDNRTIRALQAAHIQEDNYFAHAIHDDMDVIARDIREEHKRISIPHPKRMWRMTCGKALQMPSVFPEVWRKRRFVCFTISLAWTMTSWNRTSLPL
jgi:hypothetical protein